MNLIKMMNAAGIGCGKNCRCVRSFAESLGETQQAMLSHMIEQGAEKRLKKITNAGKEESEDERSHDADAGRAPSLSGFMNQLLADRQKKLHPLDILFRTLVHDEMNDSVVEPYAGELTENQQAALAEMDEKIRLEVENVLRKIIAIKGKNDPNRVIFTALENGQDAEFEVDMRADDEGQEPGPVAEGAEAA